MATIFPTAPGVVVALTDPNDSGTSPLVNVPGLDFASTTSILTGLSLQQSCNVQFFHTLGDYIFVYNFGDRMGNMGLQGLCFRRECSGGGQLGVEKVLKWYDQNKISKKSSTIKVGIGSSISVECLVVGSSVQVVDPQSKIFQYDIQLAALPEE